MNRRIPWLFCLVIPFMVGSESVFSQGMSEFSVPKYDGPVTSGPISSSFSFGTTEIPSDLAMLLRIQGPSSSLEIVDAQRLQLKNLMQKFIADSYAAGQLGDEKREQKIKSLRMEMVKGVSEILLPFQTKLWNTTMLANQGLPDVLCESHLFEGMELTEKEKIKVRQKADEIAKNLESQIAQLKIDAYEAVVRSLPAKHQLFLKEIADSEALPETLRETSTDFFISKLKMQKK